MTVKEVIDRLSVLDQDKQIFILYDSFLPYDVYFDPDCDRLVNENDLNSHYFNGCNIGDYLIQIG